MLLVPPGLPFRTALELANFVLLVSVYTLDGILSRTAWIQVIIELQKKRYSRP